MQFEQGDIIKIGGFKQKFLVVSKNIFIRKTGMIHVCPIVKDTGEGPLHIIISGINGTDGTVICERVNLIDPQARNCIQQDRIPYEQKMNVSDAIQGIFEYD